MRSDNNWWALEDSDLWLLPCKGSTLTAELSAHYKKNSVGAGGIEPPTRDL